MNQSLFCVHLNRIENILDELDIKNSRNKYPNYKSFGASYFRGKPYQDVWNVCYKKDLYDFVLQDYSLIQFKANSYLPLDISYSYLDCPIKVLLSFNDFMKQYDLSSENTDEYELLRLYEYDLFSSERKECITPIRYDFKESIYVEGRHPASHIHIGHNNEIRIASKKILRPISFILLIIRQCYPDKWIYLLNHHPDVDKLCREVRDNIADISNNYWNRKDMMEMFLF